ncbi:MAG: glycine zipper 2TM domain-containing protein [Gammaproteobacteria bacterium]
MKKIGFVAFLCFYLLLQGCASAPLCGAAGAAGGAYAGDKLGEGSKGATIGGAAAGGALGAALCN